MERVQCIVVGAGVVGLAVARSLAAGGREVVVLESESHIGTGVSSRNSGVIHAGIYYEKDSLKARFCVQGKHALYRFCEEHGVPHARIGKLIVATDAAQLPVLEKLRERARGNGVEDLEYLTPEQTRELEPVVRCAGALLSPSTGIIDAHEYMLALQGEAEKGGRGGLLSARPVSADRSRGDGLRVETGGVDAMTLDCDALVNCAGLGAQALAGSIEGLAAETIPTLYPAKGNYFQLNRPSPFQRLIYPLPDAAWLGVHVGLEPGGTLQIRSRHALVAGVGLRRGRIAVTGFLRIHSPLLAGAPGRRPAAGLHGNKAEDLRERGRQHGTSAIQGADEHGVAGLVNLYGIESPGLTSAIAIGDYVAHLIAEAA